ncbi:MAG TPA: hypothetical protein PLV25_05725, partial [Opitutales bacterium]|nr:hypothetical protein [Opitutales bacterium]
IKGMIWGQTVTAKTKALTDFIKRSAYEIELLAADQHYVEFLTLLFNANHISKAGQFKQVSGFLDPKNKAHLIELCKESLYALTVTSKGDLPEDMRAVAESFEMDKSLVDEVNRYQQDLAEYMELLNEQHTQTPKERETAAEEMKQKYATLQEKGNVVNDLIQAKLTSIESDYDTIVAAIKANEKISTIVSSSAWKSIKRNVASLVSSLLSVANMVLSVVAYLAIPILSPVAGLLSLVSKGFLLPAYKDRMFSELEELKRSWNLGNKLQQLQIAGDPELQAIADTLADNSSFKTKAFTAILSVANTTSLVLSGGLMIVGVLSSVGLIGGTAVAILNPIGLGVMGGLLLSIGALSAYKGLRSMYQSYRTLQWKRILEDTQAFDTLGKTGQFSASTPYIRKMEQQMGPDKTKWDIGAQQLANNKLRQEAIRKLIHYDMDFAIHVLMERLRAPDESAEKQSTVRFLTALDVMDSQLLELISQTTGAAKEQATLILKAKLGLLNSQLYRNAALASDSTSEVLPLE